MTTKHAPDRYPLTPMQQGMLYMSLETPAHVGCYVEQVVGVLAAPVDPERFAAAWRTVYGRFPNLANRLIWKHVPQPSQEAQPDTELPIAHLRWATCDTTDEAFQGFLDTDRRAGFRLDTAPLSRVTFIETAEGLRHFVWTIHHTLVDGRAMAQVLREVLAAYDQGASSASAPTSFAPYARRVQHPPSHETQAFWQGYLTDYASRLELPLPTPTEREDEHPSRGNFGIVERNVPLSRADLMALADSVDVTDGTIIQAAWGALLYRYTGASPVVFGATKSVRHGLDDAAHAVGLYINTLPLRLNPLADMTVHRWLTHVRHQWTALRPYENTPLSQIQSWSKLPGGEALFESTLVYERTTLDGLIKHERPAWARHEFALHECTPGPLTLAVYGGERLQLVAEFDQARFSSAAMGRLLRHLASILLAMVATPTRRLASLPLLDDNERDTLLRAWQPPAVDGSPPSVLARIDAWCERDPKAVAVEQPGEPTLTRGDLSAQSCAVAAALLARGVQPDDRVGISIPRSPNMIIGLLGILRAGAAYVPLDPAYPEDRLHHMCTDSGLREIITSEDLAPQWTAYVDAPIAIESVPATSGDRLPDIHPDDLAYVIYTSGSTGVPKGVLVSHAALGAFTCAATAAYGVRDDDRMLQFASLSFDAAVEEIFLALCNGLPLVLRTEEMLTSAAGFFAACHDARVSIIDLPTAFWHVLVDDIEHASLPPEVRIVIIGGEAAQPEKLQKWQAHVSSDVALLNTYGPTETTVVATFAALQEHNSDTPLPIGRPLPGTQAFVLDANRALTPTGVPGELYLGGPQVARGYHRRPDLNQKRFVTSPFNPGARLYRTGDRVCYRDDGQLVYLGRFDRQVKLRGFRIELDGIESALREHAAVRDAVVSVFEPAPGQGQLAAYVVAESPGAEDRLHEVLRHWLADRLPAYMHPAAWTTLSRLPLSGTGKIDYSALPAPQPDRLHDLTPPETPTEERLVQIWREVLGIDDVGCTHEFFDLGGHSLLAVQMIARIRHELHKDPPLLAVFDHATIRDLAAYLDGMEEIRKDQGLRPVARGAGMPLSFDQQVLWLFEQVYPGTQTYHIPIAYRLRGPLHIDLLERALAAIVARHESLRTTFAVQSGEPVQVIGTPYHVPLPVFPLPDGAGAEQQRIHQWLCDRSVLPFNLTTGPLLHGAILRVSEEDHVLCLVVHHIIFDGWSVGVLVKDLRALYTAFLEDAPSPLPPLALQYADYAVWERTRFDPVNNPSAAYWRNKMAKPLPHISWPEDPSNSAPDPRQGAQVSMRIPRDLVKALQQTDPSGSTSLFMKLLAVFNILLARYAGGTDFIVGATSANRDYVELERLTGFFINTIGLRTRVNLDDSFRDLLAQEKRVVLEAQAHQDLPFYLLREIAQDLKDDRPLMQTLFLMQSMDIPPLHLPRVTAETLNVDMGKAIVDLTLELYETEAGLHGWFEYATKFFSAETMARLAQYYLVLLETVARQPDAPLRDLPHFDAVAPVDPQALPPVWVVPTPPEKVRPTISTDIPGMREVPQDDIEKRLAALWGRVLSRQHVYRHDNFFKIGGQSLLAVVMLGQVERVFGQRITPLSLYQSPTLSGFAALLRADGIKPPRTSVHALRQAGRRTPLFFIGSTDLFSEVADALGPDQPVYSLNIFGLQEEDGGYTFTSVPDIAARFIEDMRVVQPTGPYVLGGYCRDTMVAYEMARQLEAVGEEVSHLALVDVYWDTWDAYGRWQRHFRNLYRMGPSYITEKFRGKMKAYQEHFNRLYSRWIARRQEDTALAHAHRDTLFINAYYDIVAASEPGPYGGDVTLYIASEWGLRDVPNWRRIVGGRVTMEEFDACHYNLWRQPQAGRLGALMRAHLDTLAGAGTTPSPGR